MPEKKETSLGIAIFLYVIAVVLACILAYNVVYISVFNNYELTQNLTVPTAEDSIFYNIAYKYVSLFFNLFGNTGPCVVISVLFPLDVAVTLAAGANLSDHFESKAEAKRGKR